MPVTHIHTYLVHPRTAGAAPIGGADIPLWGDLFDMLRDIYQKSDHQCNIDISFNAVAGAQQNPSRDLILAYVIDPTIDRGRDLAIKLQGVSDGRSGMGLLFLIKGIEGADHKVVISRFPADNGILAEMEPGGLTVEFLNRVFMKNAFSYKAAVYSGPAMQGAFWLGRAVDRQTNDPVVGLSEYWIKKFLESDYRVTPAAGTRRLALALKEAARTVAGPEDKHALAAVAALAPGLNGVQTSGDEFLQQFPLSPAAQAAVRAAFKSPAAAAEQFVFMNDEFSQHIAYRSVQLDTGAILTAENTNFDEVFEQGPVDAEGKTTFSTTGAVVQEKLRGGKVAI